MHKLHGAAFVTAPITETPITTGNKIAHRSPEKGQVSGDRHFSRQSGPSRRWAGRGEGPEAPRESVAFLLSVY